VDDHRRHDVVGSLKWYQSFFGQPEAEALKHVARRHPWQELHVVLDNSSTHGAAEVKEWLAKNPRVHFQYTPKSASWLNQVEGFFGILESSRSASRTFRARPRSASTRRVHRALERRPDSLHLEHTRDHPLGEANA
jgi:transposase